MDGWMDFRFKTSVCQIWSSWRKQHSSFVFLHLKIIFIITLKHLELISTTSLTANRFYHLILKKTYSFKLNEHLQCLTSNYCPLKISLISSWLRNQTEWILFSSGFWSHLGATNPRSSSEERMPAGWRHTESNMLSHNDSPCTSPGITAQSKEKKAPGLYIFFLQMVFIPTLSCTNPL